MRIHYTYIRVGYVCDHDRSRYNSHTYVHAYMHAHVHAGEVLLAAGALASPHLLQLSGIGKSALILTLALTLHPSHPSHPFSYPLLSPSPKLHPSPPLTLGHRRPVCPCCRGCTRAPRLTGSWTGSAGPPGGDSRVRVRHHICMHA